MTALMRGTAVRYAIAFFALTLFLSFGFGLMVAAASRAVQSRLVEILAVIILLSPTIAAIMLTVRANGWGGLSPLLSPLLTWRVPIRWYLVALFLPTILNLSSLGIYILLDGSIPLIPGAVPRDLEPLITDRIPTTALFLTLFFVLSSLVEEIGWRGYALPRLQSRLTALSSSLVIGVIWAVWHVPTFVLLPGSAQSAIPFSWYLPSTLAISVVFTWLYNNTRGSLLQVTILHASIQATNVLLPTLPSTPGETQLYALNVIVVITVAAIILILSGHRNLSRTQPRVTR